MVGWEGAILWWWGMPGGRAGLDRGEANGLAVCVWGSVKAWGPESREKTEGESKN